MTFEERYANGTPTACMNRDGASVAAVAMLITTTGISWMDEQYVLGVLHPRPPTHHLFGPVTRDGEELLCEGHRFRLVTHGDETAGDWNEVLKIRNIVELHADAESVLAQERRV